jgi:hypothetical protein
MKNRLIDRAYRKIEEYSIQRAYEHAIDEMVKRGFDPTSVKKIGGKIKIEVDKDEKTGYEVDFVEAKNIEELVEKHIDAEIDQPRYRYDEDFETGLNQALIVDGYEMIRPGEHVDIDALREWVMTTKINRDPELQEAVRMDVLKVPVNLHDEWVSTLDRVVDRIVFKVARKIYYVGKKPITMTPEEWDDYTRNMKPEPGTYAKNEDWGERGFPYGADYTYRQGSIDIPEDSLTSQAIHKGWKEGGWGGVKL